MSSMPSIDDARILAERFASEASLRTGRPWRGFVEEFAQGWAVWAAPPAGERTALGAVKTVLDRETGAVSKWPSWPGAVLSAQYEMSRAALPATAPPPFPGVLPLMSRERFLECPDGRIWRAESWLDDSEPDSAHHPLVTQWLSTQTSLVRGAARHAELLLLSAVLSDANPPDLRECATEGRPCDTCLQAYVHFGLLDETALEFAAQEEGVLSTEVPAFPDGRPFDPARWAQFAFELLSPAHAPVEAARRAIEQRPVAVSTRRGPGHELWIRPFRIGVTHALTRHAPALTGFSELLEAVLFPLGQEEGGDGVITIDGHGRVFVLDQAGAWFCGSDIDTAVATLAEGFSMPRERLIPKPTNNNGG